MVFLCCLSTILLSFIVGNVQSFENKFSLLKNQKGEDVVKNILHSILKNAADGHSKQLFHNVLTRQSIGQPSEDKLLKEKAVDGCACVKKNCGCCAHIEVKKIDLNETVCANVSYLPKEYGISVTVTLGRYTLINETISASNPPPICADIPHLKKYASICIRLHDLDVQNSTFHGCIGIEVRLIEVLEKEFELGCFDIPYKETKDVTHSDNLSTQHQSPTRDKKDKTLYFKRLPRDHSNI